MTDHTTHYDASEHHHDDCGCQSERLRKELAAAQAQIVALREALTDLGEHSRECARGRFEGGRPTEGGGYEQRFAGKWYESRPEDRTPQCDCGLDAALSQPTGTEALRAFGERCVAAGQKDAFDEISAMDAGVARKQQDAAAIVARILGESGVANG